MNGVPFICIDPHLVSLPQVDRCSSDDVEDFVSAVVDWASTADGKCTSAFVSSGVLDAIDDDDAFPWGPKLEALLKHYGVRSVSAVNVVQAVQSLLGCARIDDTIGIKSVLLEPSKTNLSTRFMRERLRPKTQQAFDDMLAILSLAQTGVGDVDNIAIGSMPGRGEKATLAYISFAAEVADIEWSSLPQGKTVTCPYQIDGKLSVFFSRSGLLEKIEPVSLWPDDEDVDKAKHAIDCCIARLIASGASEEKKKPYVIASRFLKSADDWHCGRDGRHNFTLIESCARLVLGIPKHDIGEFRDNKTGKQKVRDDRAVACRTHVTKRGAGLRLMFWELADGTIEFANVGDKDELVMS